MRESLWTAGREKLVQLTQDPQFQQYLHYIDQLAPRSKAGCRGGDADIETVAQQRLSRITRDIQRRVKHVQDDETQFRLVVILYVCMKVYVRTATLQPRLSRRRYD